MASMLLLSPANLILFCARTFVSIATFAIDLIKWGLGWYISVISRIYKALWFVYDKTSKITNPITKKLRRLKNIVLGLLRGLVDIVKASRAAIAFEKRRKSISLRLGIGNIPFSSTFLECLRKVTRLISFLFDAATRLSGWVLVFLLFVVIDATLGSSLRMAAHSPHTVLEVLYAISLNLRDFFNGLIRFTNVLTLVANSINPLYSQIVSAAFEFMTTILSLDVTRPQKRDLMSIDEDGDVPISISTGRSLSTTPANPLFTEDKVFKHIESGFQIAQIPAIVSISVGLDILLFLIEFIRTILYPIFRLVGEQFGGAVRGGACCSLSPEAAGCCVAEAFASLITSFLKLIGIPFDENARKGITCRNQNIPGVSCKCSLAEGGVFTSVASCPLPGYSCVSEKSGDSEIFFQYLKNQGSDSNDRGSLVRSGRLKEVACLEYLAQTSEQPATRDLGNKFSCVTVCDKIGTEMWQFETCDDDNMRYYKGHCIKHLSKPQRRRHLQKYFVLAKTPRTERQRLLYTTRADPSSVPSGLTLDDFKRALGMIESRVLDGSDCDLIDFEDDWVKSFAVLSYRYVCIGIKLLKTDFGPIRDKLIGIVSSTVDIGPARRHLNVVIEHSALEVFNYTDFHRAIRNSHIEEYKKITGKDSFLVHTEAFIDATFNKTVTLAEFVNNGYNKHKEDIARGRKLSSDGIDRGVFSNPDGAECEYRCPDGINCVLKRNRQRCPTPTVWSVGVLVRYVFHVLGSGVGEFDIGDSIYSAFDCWQGYRENPSTDPTLVSNYIRLITGEDIPGIVYCFPLWKHIGYLPEITFDLNMFVDENCHSEFDVDKGKTVKRCVCPQYNTYDLFNHEEYVMIFLDKSHAASIYNTNKIMLYEITRIPYLSGFLDAIWSTTVSIFTINKEIVMAFNTKYQEHGLSPWWNRTCLTLNYGSLLWTLTWIILPLAAFFNTFFIPYLVFIGVISPRKQFSASYLPKNRYN